jgi:hypothetical protein
MENLPRPPRPVEKIGIDERDFSLDKAMPRLAAARETQRDRNDAIADIKKRFCTVRLPINAWGAKMACRGRS